MTPCYIFDIDGTLANNVNRLHFILREPKDWSGFYAACSDDEPIQHMCNLLAAIVKSTLVVVVSNRSDECRDKTLSWLLKHTGLDFSDTLYMRKAGDHRDDDVIKIELLAQIRSDGYEPIMAFDDRNRVVKAWRAAGVPCAQVAEGDF